MTSADDFWFASLLLRGTSEEEKLRAVDDAAQLLAELPASCLRDDTVPLIEAARRGDVDARAALAGGLDLLRAQLERPVEESPRKAAKPRRSEAINPSTVTPDTPLRLDAAVKLAFPAGGMTVSGLRREAARGRLKIEAFAGKHFTTLRAIEEMRNQCRDQQKAQDSGSNPRSGTAKVALSGGQRGSSATDRVRSARAALERTAQGLNVRSASTSPANTKSPASGTVIHLKSSS